MTVPGVFMVFFAVAAASQAQSPLPATDVTNADIPAFLKALFRDVISDLSIRARYP